MGALDKVWSDPAHDDWAGLGSRLRYFVSDVADRKDLVVRLEPVVDNAGRIVMDAGLTPAMFVPAEARVRICAQRVLRAFSDDPATIDPVDRRDQVDFPVLMGAAAHDCARTRR